MLEPLVSICCLAYNQVSFIRQCLDGFLMQKTSFPIEIIIHDDASTDGTTDVIREYEQRYRAILQPVYQTENQYSKGFPLAYFNNVLFSMAQGKYIAICEGDDYWIDPYKLEKQIQFLENNPEYGFSHTKALIFNQVKNKFAKETLGFKDHSFLQLIYSGNCVSNLTVCFRKDLLNNYIKEIHPERENWSVDDYPRLLWFANNSKIHFLDEITGVYRALGKSLSHFKSYDVYSEYTTSIENIVNYFMTKYCSGYDKKEITIVYLFQRILSSVKYYNFQAFKDNLFTLKKLTKKRLTKYSIISKSKLLFTLYFFWLHSTIADLLKKRIIRPLYRIMIPNTIRNSIWEADHFYLNHKE